MKPGEQRPIPPGYGNALATGARSGVFVVDLDNKNGKNGIDAFAALGDCSRTLTVTTPSGGRHLYFNQPDGFRVPNSASKLGPGVDVRGDGGFVCIPPTSGYAPINAEAIADAPTWLLDLVLTPDTIEVTTADETEPPTREVLATAERIAAEWPPAISGQRGHDRTFRLALELVRGLRLPAAIALPLMREWNARCRPPWSARDLARKVDQAITAAHVPWGFRLTAGHANATTISDAWTAVPDAWLSTAPPPRRWLICHPSGEGVLPLGRAGVLSAAGGTGKTMLLVQLAIAIATGRPWLGHFMIGEQGRVLLGLAEETADECHRRIHAAAADLTDSDRDLVAAREVVLPLMGQRPALISADDRGRVSETAALAELRRLLVERAGPDGWRLIALDPFSRWLPGAEGNNDVATAAISIVESLCSVPGGPTVLVAAHSSKLARREGRADTRGVTGTIDAARWEAQLWADGDELVLSQTKSNYSRPWPSDLRLVRGPFGVLRVQTAAEQHDTVALRANVAAAEREAKRRAEHARAVERVYQAIAAGGPEGVRNVDGLVGPLGLGRQVVRDAVASLLAHGRVVRDGARTQTRLFTLTPLPPTNAAGASPAVAASATAGGALPPPPVAMGVWGAAAAVEPAPSSAWSPTAADRSSAP